MELLPRVDEWVQEKKAEQKAENNEKYDSQSSIKYESDASDMSRIKGL
jgi:hypothetical protein